MFWLAAAHLGLFVHESLVRPVVAHTSWQLLNEVVLYSTGYHVMEHDLPTNLYDRTAPTPLKAFAHFRAEQGLFLHMLRVPVFYLIYLQTNINACRSHRLIHWPGLPIIHWWHTDTFLSLINSAVKSPPNHYLEFSVSLPTTHTHNFSLFPTSRYIEKTRA